MHRLGKVAGALLLLFLMVLARPGTVAHAAPGPEDSADARAARRAKPAAAATPDGYLYVVQPGDTAWDIAAAHDLTIDELAARNQTQDISLLMPGQSVFVPAQPHDVPRKPSATPPPTPAPPPAAPAAQPAVPAGQVPAQQSAPPAETPPPAPPAETPPPTPSEAPAPEALAAPAAPTALAPELAAWASTIVDLMNAQRTAAGRPALTWSPELAAAAQAHAEDCGQRRYGSHVGSDGASLRTRLARAGYAASVAGENWANTRNGEQAFNMWWNESPGNDPHRRAIMNPQYTEIGIGIARGPWGFYFIADFGTR